MEKKGANVRRKSEKRKPPRARRERILNYRKWPRRPCRNSMNCVTCRYVIRTSPGGADAHMRTHDGDTHTHTHTHTHFQVQGLEKGVSENEAPGPVGAYTTTHNDTITLMPNLIQRISFTELSHAGCRGYIGRQEHPETQSNTRTYGTKKSSYIHAYIGKDGKWRKRAQT